MELDGAADVIIKSIKMLDEYPIKKEVPKWADPNNEMHQLLYFYEEYPGKDYVLGFCDEIISEYTSTLSRAKFEEVKLFCGAVIQLFQKARKRRLEKLKAPKGGAPTYKRVYNPRNKYKGQAITGLYKLRSEMEVWLKDNDQDPNYPAKLMEYERLCNEISTIEITEALF